MPKGGSTAPAGRKIISTRKAQLLCTAALVLVQVGAAVSQEITVPQPESITLDSDDSELNIRSGGSIEKVTPKEKGSSAVLSIGRNNKVLIEVDGKILNEAAVLIIPTPGRSLCGSSAGWAVSHPPGDQKGRNGFGNRSCFLVFGQNNMQAYLEISVSIVTTSMKSIAQTFELPV